jgi:hypothetical protein
MATTQNNYTGNGTNKLFSITFPYLETTDIFVFVNGAATTAYTFANATTIEMTTAPANGATVVILRSTDDTNLQATFFPGSSIKASDLNNDFDQVLFIAQETTNTAQAATFTAATATTTANTALSQSSAAVSTANTASSNASAAVSTANAASATAASAVSTANTASTNASNAVTTANTASSNATAAVNTANTASSNISAALSIANAALPKAGGTMTGNLEIGTTGSLTFEGSTADGFETTLAVVDPTADRTITLPNVTGTVVTTGDTGTVTSTMILDGTILNADINASAAIVDTKLNTISTAGKVSNSATTATHVNTGSTIVARDASGNFSAGSITASLNGIAAFVSTNANLTGDVTSVGNATAIAAGVIVNADVNASAAIADTKLATIATAGKVSNSATTAASANTASAIVARDASGNFTAGTITAALTGAASDNVLKSGDTMTGDLELAGLPTLNSHATRKSYVDAGDSSSLSAANSAQATADAALPKAGGTMTGALAVTAGTAALPGIAVSGDLNTGIYSPGADQLAISTGGTGQLFVNAAGNVGVGTAPRSWPSTIDALQIGPNGGTLYASSGTNVASLLLASNAYIPAESPSILKYTTTAVFRQALGYEQNTLVGSHIWYNSPSNRSNATTSVVSGLRYTVSTLGSTTLAEWQALFSALTVLPTVNQVITATATGTIAGGATVEPTVAFAEVMSINNLGTTTVTAAANQPPFIAKIDATEVVRIDGYGQILYGTSSLWSNSTAARVNIASPGTSSAPNLHLGNFSASTTGPTIGLYKSRSTTAGGFALVANGDSLGNIFFGGADGATYYFPSASITAVVDGTPGVFSIPGRLVFSTGATYPTERYRITNDGVLCRNQPAPATYAAAATLTVANLKTGIITYTGAAATLTLPTGTLTEGGFSGIYTNMTFEWSVINTGTDVCTIGAGTDHTIVGSGIVAIGASGRFASRRTAVNTFVSYRLS